MLLELDEVDGEVDEELPDGELLLALDDGLPDWLLPIELVPEAAEDVLPGVVDDALPELGDALEVEPGAVELEDDAVPDGDDGVTVVDDVELRSVVSRPHALSARALASATKRMDFLIAGLLAPVGLPRVLPGGRNDAG